MTTTAHTMPLAEESVRVAALDDATTLTGALEALVRERPDFECLTIVQRDGGDDAVSLRALWQRAQCVRATLQHRRLAPGRGVLLILPTGVELVSAYFGAMLAGDVPSLLAGPTNRFADAGTYARLVRALVGKADAAAIYCDDDVAALLRATLDWDGVILTPREVVAEAAPGATGAADPDGVATMQYSSGSTGIPKGVLLTHRAMLNNIRAIRDGLGLTASDVSVNWIPLYHDMGLIDAFLLPLLIGCRTILMPTTDFMREPGRWMWAMHTYRGTISWAPNFAYALCATRMSDDDRQGLDLSSWRIAINAAEPVLAETIGAFAARFAPHGFRPEAMTPAWGLAENVTLATAHPIGQRPWIETIDASLLSASGRAVPAAGDGVDSVAVGRCLPRCEVQIRNQAGDVLGHREVGTIWLRSDSLFSGYFRDADSTAALVDDGWLDTGDRGYLAGEDLFFVSREKDLVVIGGEKYSPHHIETVINDVPGVRKGCAVVFGVLNRVRGTEEVVAVVETREDDAMARAELEAAIGRATRLSTGLVLRRVLLVPPGGVEKTTSGKLARAATHRRWAAELGTVVG